MVATGALIGYSYCGQAFQCYRCEEPLETGDRYVKQRDKLSSDIRKFIDNRDELERTVQRHYGRRWNFVVPLADSASLVKHANKKAKEVIATQLPYVTTDFRVHVETARHLRSEIIAYAQSRSELRLAISEPSGEAIERFLSGNNVLVNNLHRKLGVLHKSQGTSDARSAALVRAYLRGSNLLEQLRRATPSLWNKTVALEKAFEDELEFIGAQAGTPQSLQAALSDFRDRLMKETRSLVDEDVSRIAQYTVAGALMRCSLDFVE